MWFNHGGYMGGNLGFFGFGLGVIFNLIFWALIIWGVYVLIRKLSENGEIMNRKKDDSAMDILKERFAKGEISKEEFEEKKNVLIKNQ